jgi:hypothetical protein
LEIGPGEGFNSRVKTLWVKCPGKEVCMIELTPEQRQALQNGEQPMRVRDPETNATYVLVRSEVYERVKTLFEEEDDNQLIRDMYPQVMEVFGREGWDDPEMDIYNELDPRRHA